MATYTHKVRAFDSAKGTITISVHDSADAQVDLMGVDLPQDADGLYLVGDALKTHIEGFFATEFYDKSATIKAASPSNSSAITAMIVAYPEEEAVEEADTTDSTNAIIDTRLTTHGLIQLSKLLRVMHNEGLICAWNVKITNRASLEARVSYVDALLEQK